MDFSTMSNDDLAAALTEKRAKATEMFALTEVTPAQADEAEALMASIGEIEAEQARRAKVAKDAADKFASLRDKFAVNDGVEDSEEDAEEDAEVEAEEDAEVDSEEDTEVEADAEADAEADGGEDGGDAVTTASADPAMGQRVKVSAARKVGRKVKRPAVAANRQVTITAANDVPNFAVGQPLNDMETVTKALLNRAKGFAPFNESAARAVRSASGGAEVLQKFGVASFGLNFDGALVASSSDKDYGAYQTALKEHRAALAESMEAALNGQPATLSAAGWCAPSETVYSFIADYVVDGLLSMPEVNAPRGGINITTGPAHVTYGETALNDFGFVQTEAQAEAGTVKTCETIECPEFEDHRLDAIGYCYKIPLLTQKAYPELITDALRLANVLYAHKVNRRLINDIVALSDDVDFSGYGASLTDALEALSLVAMRERRKWNIGENAIMEVKAPLALREVFRADMSRRTGLALTDIATDQKIAAEFAARRLAVEYVADWQEISFTGNIVLPGSFDVLIYPSGTFVKAVEDVISLQAVYDAASLSVNEYTGVFFEQGILTAKVGYGSSKVTIPVNTAGETGAAIMQGLGDGTAAGSF